MPGSIPSSAPAGQPRARPWSVDQTFWRVILDQIAIGVIVIDSSLRVVATNKCADELLRSNRGLVIRAGRLSTERRQQSRQLQSFLAGANRNSGVCTETRLMLLRREIQDRPLELCCIAWMQTLRLLFVFDPAHPPPVDHLCERLYGLTRSERQVAEALLAGYTVRESAAQLGLSIHTVRTHLKRMFRKTRTRRQAELLHLLSGGLALLSFE